MKNKTNRSDGRYEVKHTVPGEYFPDGKQRRKSFYSYTSKSDAERQYEEYLTGLKSTFIPTEDMTVGEWASRWLAAYKKGKVKENTYETSYRRPVENVIVPHLGTFRLSRIRSTDVNLLFAKISPDYSASYLHKVKLCLEDMFERALDDDYIQKNPCRKLTLPEGKKSEEKRVYTEKQRDDLLAYAIKSHSKDGMYVEILLTVGLRCSELCGLQSTDLDDSDLTLTISRAATDLSGMVVVAEPKSKESRRVLPVSKDFADRFREIFLDKGYIVTQKDKPDTPVNPKNLQKRLSRFLQKFADENDPDFPILTPHELRHTCGTLLYRKTHDLYAVSRYMGHSSTEITAKYYVHNDTEALRNSLKI